MFAVTVPRFNPTDVVITPHGNLSALAIRVLNTWRQSLQQQVPAGLFASVPNPATEGMLFAVTDSTTNTWGAVIAGGGANHVLAFFNGTAWTVAAK